jgi:CRISPR-associated protein Csm3
MKQLKKKIRINTKLNLVTGLHIGGNTDSVEIGGLDNPVIKLASKEGQPYIPGSSLKGKMRCLLEQIAGSAEIGGDKEVNNLFGITDKKDKGKTVREGTPSKLIVRDATLTKESVEFLQKCDDLDMPFTENKWENTIDRVTATANPRQMERVPAGVSFDVEFVINIWDDDNEDDLKELLRKGMNALENDYLGGSGSRGSGQISFEKPWNETELSDENNWNA